jgi:iron complex outermembrane recepter protein
MLKFPYKQFKRNFKISFLLFLFSISLFGQSNLKKINGKLVDTNKSPILFAYVSLLQVKDSLLLQTTLTDVNGNYEFKDLEGITYLIRFHCLGFKDGFLTLTDGLNSYDMVMQPDEIQLNEVVVSANQLKSPIQIQPDRTVINVSESVNSTGTDLFDMLRKSPGIKIAGEDKILIEGKEGVRVYIDGIVVNLKGNDLTTLLKGIQTSNIEKMEIISNPSTKYDADGKGVIVIKTKKGGTKGFNSSVSLNANVGRYYPKCNGGFSLNFRNENVNLYGNYDYALNKYKNFTDYLRKQNNANEISTNYNQHYANDSKRHGNNFRTGIDLYLTNRSTIGFLINGNFNYVQNNSLSNTAIYQDISNINSTLTAKNNQITRISLFGYNLNYKYADSTEKSLTIDANHSIYNYKSNSYQPNTYTDNVGNLIDEKIYQNYSSTGIQINSIKADYTQKILKGVFDIGLKCSDVKSVNNLDAYNIVKSTFIADTGKTNDFSYSEKIIAAYATFSLNIEKWSGRIGLRVENSSNYATLLSIVNKEIQAVNSNYCSFFPNAFLSYQLTSIQTISLLYNKNIDRPAYKDLNPFVFVFDELSYSKGNPFLRPQLSDNFKLSHILKKKITSSFSFTNTRDFIFQYRDTTRGKTFVSSININHQRLYNLGISVQHSFVDWWDFYTSYNAFRQIVGGVVGNNTLDMAVNAFSFSSNNTFSFLKSWKIELSGFINSSYLDAPAIVNMQWSVDIGVQKKILKDAGTLKLAISDIFNSLDFSLSRDYGGLYYTNKNKWESQQIKFAFNYRFGNRNTNPIIERERGSKEEEKRIK